MWPLAEGSGGQQGRAERRGLGHVRDMDRPTEKIGLELHQQS